MGETDVRNQLKLVVQALDMADGMMLPFILRTEKVRQTLREAVDELDRLEKEVDRLEAMCATPPPMPAQGVTDDEREELVRLRKRVEELEGDPTRRFVTVRIDPGETDAAPEKEVDKSDRPDAVKILRMEMEQFHRLGNAAAEYGRIALANRHWGTQFALKIVANALEQERKG